MKLTLTTCACALLFIPACTMKSLHAGYTKDSITQEKGAEGSWINEERKVMLTVLPMDGRYSVLVTLLGDEEADEPEKTVRLKVALFRVGAEKTLSLAPGALFADASLSDDAWDETGLARLFTVRTHSICRVEVSGDALTIRELKGSAVDDLLKKDEAALDHVHMDDEVVMNAPPKALQEFLAKHGGDEAFFEEADAGHRFRRVK